MRQQYSVCSFSDSNSWVILSPIEQSIKRKIEAIGVPLKDWDIQINYGIKTGLNDAFIITTVKRDEILANCQTKEERQRTTELIRPILRGRDIKRYGYEWANLYLIATFPARRYNIEQYPAVKHYLLSFAYDYLVENNNELVAKNHLEEYCMKKLSQSGEYIIINEKYVLDGRGNKEKSRKKTSNKWFETQDSISYWDDFNRPKIVWGNLNLNGSYCIAPKGMFINAPSPFIATSNLAILHILNSKIADYYIRSLGVTRNGGYFEYKPMFVEKFPIPLKGLSDISSYPSTPTKQQEQEIDNLVCRLYGLTAEEISFIHRQ